MQPFVCVVTIVEEDCVTTQKNGDHLILIPGILIRWFGF